VALGRGHGRTTRHARQPFRQGPHGSVLAERTDWYIKENRKRLSENYALTIKFLREHDVPYTPGANSAFFVWVNLGEAVRRRRVYKSGQSLEYLRIGDGHGQGGDNLTAEIMSKLLEQKALASGQAFSSERPG
jgi:hypothetical protein